MMTGIVSGGSPGPAAEVGITATFPATANQAQVWHEAQLLRTGTALNAAFRRRIEGRISDSAISHALQALVDRHEILRTRFRETEEGKLVQDVLTSMVFKPDLVDLRHMPSPQREDELERLGAAEARTPFAIIAGQIAAPLFRVLVVRLSQELAYVHFTFHHLVIDGWSVEIVIDEFARLAAARDAGKTADLPAVEMQFGDFAMWQTDVLASGALDPERDYWRNRLAGLPRFEVRPDRIDALRDGDGEIRSVLLSPELSAAFDNLARTHSHTAFSMASAAAAAALHLITGEAEVVLGTQMACREDPEAEAIIGTLLNTVVLRVPAHGSDRFLAFAAAVRASAVEAMQHHALPFAEVLHDAAANADADRSPLYSINLVVQRTNIASASTLDRDYGAFRVASAASHSSGALWDISLFMVQREEGWRLSCEGARALYDTATIDALLAVWRRVIEGAVANPDAALADLVELEGHERRPWLRQNGTIAPAAVRPAPAPVRHNPRLEALEDRITVLQPDGADVPVIAINNASVLYPVARAIGSDHPFYDIAYCPSPVRVALPRRHFQDYARDAVEMIRLARPHGPYVLFGLCIMGAIAIEAARILRSEGEEVPLVVLNDTYRPGFREHMGWYDRTLRRWQVRWQTFHALRTRFRAGELTGAQWLDNYRLVRKLGLTRLLVRMGLLQPGTAGDAMQEHNRWFPEEVLLPSQAEFAIEPYDGRVVLFRNTELEESRLFPRDLAWTGYLTGEFEVIDCPGNHDTMFRSEGAAVIGSEVVRILGER